MLTRDWHLVEGHERDCDTPTRGRLLGEGLSRHFPAVPTAPKAPCRKRRCTLTEEPFFLLLGIPPNRNFKPAIFFPFPFFFPSLEPLIFFRTPGPGETEDLFGTLQTAVPQITPPPQPRIYREDGRALGTTGSRAAASTIHRARPLGRKAASPEPALVKNRGRKASALGSRRGTTDHRAANTR